MSDTHDSVASLVAKLAHAKVLCVGDLMLDQFVYGDVRRISPEAPVPVLRVDRTRSALGGVGNVGTNLSTLGAEVGLVAVVGDDEHADTVEQLVAEQGITAHLFRVTCRKTSLKTRFIADSQQVLRVDHETTDTIEHELGARVVQSLTDVISSYDVVVVSDYAKGFLTDDLLANLFQLAKRASVPVLVDPKGGNYQRYRGATAVTPNTKEIGELSAAALDDDQSFSDSAKALLEAGRFEAVLVTRGPQGMTLATRDQCTHLTARARQVFDVSGAGDTVIATLAAARAVGASWLQSAQLANQAAGVVVEKIGTAVVELSELHAAVTNEAENTPRRKIVALAGAEERVARWRAQGLTIGFTNGCFDLLHPGHLALLEQAAEACDRLIVGLNSDASVTRLKGDGRPVQNQSARSIVLASVETVDLVVIFDGDTPLPEIDALAPDVLVKGADYKESEVVGADIVKSRGGRVLLATLVDGQSTSATVNQLSSMRGSGRQQ